jgi:hypothetical protein
MTSPPPPDSSDDDGGHNSYSPDDDGYPGYNPGRGLLRPWPRVHRLVGGASQDGFPWLSLPSMGGGTSWSTWLVLEAPISEVVGMGVSRTPRPTCVHVRPRCRLVGQSHLRRRPSMRPILSRQLSGSAMPNRSQMEACQMKNGGTSIVPCIFPPLSAQ